MVARLLEAAQIGDIGYLHKLLTENPFILNNTALFSSENPLHIASIAGHLDFVREILRLKLEFANEINQDGFSPMHMAAARGHIEIVQELMKVDSRLCRLEGKEKKTPLHCAAIKGRAEVVSVMLLCCPNCIEDVTIQGETALHLAVKMNQFQAVNALLDLIRELNREGVLNLKDELGNTILHLAAWKKRRQVIELFLGSRIINSGILEVNAKNNSGLTALDLLLIFPSEAGDTEITEILRGVGPMRAKDISLSPMSSFQSANQNSAFSTPEICQTEQSNLVDYFKFKKGRDSPSEARISPPGGVWEDSYMPDQSNNTKAIIRKAHYAGESILATSGPIAFALFVLFNTIGLSVSLFMIHILTSRFPLQFELQMCIVAMYFTYNTALINMSPDEMKLYVVLVTVILSSLTPIIAKFIRLHAKKIGEFVVDMIHCVI
ncbi:hypothetical protein P3X46_030733 [Hevea brasiliensis]|uniref:PGG domain-containing protein n=1 Tax=Hevea brasiliensis TaxID=3981 RepID=A0ABQ9KI64_HEVBR|nr:hypothetical protein P3X46_030733 [Hevea brasiliensis]